MNKKLSMILAGIAAYGYYKYTKMTSEEKDNLINGLKEKGKKLYDQYVPDNVKEKFEQYS